MVVGDEADQEECRKEDICWGILSLLSFMVALMAWVSLAFRRRGWVLLIYSIQYMHTSDTIFALRNLPIDKAHIPNHRIGGAAKCGLDIFVVGTAVIIRHFFGSSLSAALVLIGFTISSIGSWRLVYFSKDINLWDVPIQASMQFAVCITGDSGLEALKAVLILCGVITFYRCWFYNDYYYYFVDEEEEVDHSLSVVIPNGGVEVEHQNRVEEEDDKVSRLNSFCLFLIALYIPFLLVESECVRRQSGYRNRTRSQSTIGGTGGRTRNPTATS